MLCVSIISRKRVLFLWSTSMVKASAIRYIYTFSLPLILTSKVRRSVNFLLSLHLRTPSSHTAVLFSSGHKIDNNKNVHTRPLSLSSHPSPAPALARRLFQHLNASASLEGKSLGPQPQPLSLPLSSQSGSGFRLRGLRAEHTPALHGKDNYVYFRFASLRCLFVFHVLRCGMNGIFLTSF